MANKTLDQFVPQSNPLLGSMIFAAMRSPGGGSHVTIYFTLQQLLDFIQANITAGASGYASYAALRAETLLVDGRIYIASGYATPGDQPGKFYRYDSASNDADDDGSTIKPTSVGGGAGRFKLILG